MLIKPDEVDASEETTCGCDLEPEKVADATPLE
jgi:hypothetical protein